MKGGISYREIFGRALHTTRAHFSLWPLAAVAGLGLYGVALRDLGNTFFRIQFLKGFSWQTVEQAVSGAPWVLTYARQLALAEPFQRNLQIILLTFAVVVILLAIVSAQQLVIFSVARDLNDKARLGLKATLQKMHHLHLLRVLGLNASNWVLNILLSILCALPLAQLLTTSPNKNFFVYLAVYTLALPIAFTINAVTMLTLSVMVRKDWPLIKAFHSARAVFTRNWLTILEFSALAFLLNLVFFLMLIVALIIVIIPLSVFSAVALTLGSLFFMSLASLLAASLSAVIIIAYGGATTAFNYACWVELGTRLEKKGIIPYLESHIRSLVGRFV